jgi:hypothetical protein
MAGKYDLHFLSVYAHAHSTQMQEITEVPELKSLVLHTSPALFARSESGRPVSPEARFSSDVQNENRLRCPGIHCIDFIPAFTRILGAPALHLHSHLDQTHCHLLDSTCIQMNFLQMTPSLRFLLMVCPVHRLKRKWKKSGMRSRLGQRYGLSGPQADCINSKKISLLQT